MAVASVRETANFTNNTNAVTPYTLGQVLAAYATTSYVAAAIAQAVIDPSQIDLSAYAKKTDLPSKLSQLTNDSNYVQTVSGLIPSNLLPSYVDDVVEVSNYSSLPNPGETGKIYVTLNDNLTYRWGGSDYVEISKSLAIGTTSETAFRGDYGNIAYTHSQTTGNPHSLTLSDLSIVVTPQIINYLTGLDDNIVTKLNSKLSLSGGVLTGFLTLHADPTQKMHAATKDYVDKEINGISVTVTQNVTHIKDLEDDLDSLSATVGIQADTIVDVQNDITGLNQTTSSHTSSISSIQQNINSITSTVSETQETVTNLEASVNQLSAELNTQALFVLIDQDGYPLETKTYEITYTVEFRGNTITPDSVSLSGTHTGITAQSVPAQNKITFAVDDSVAIPSELNMYSITFSYTSGDFPWTLTKNVAVVTVPQGETGPAGQSGQPGPSGKSVDHMVEMYYKSTSSSQMIDGSWVNTFPGWSQGYYIWTKTRTVYTDTTYSDTEPVMVTDTTTGWTTIDGIGIATVDVLYYLSTSNQTTTGGSWVTTVPAYDPDKYLWTKTRTTYTNDFADETAPSCVTGAKGANGIGVSNSILYFKTVSAGSSAPSAPNTLTPDAQSGWSTSEPTIDLAKDLYATTETVYTNNTFSYSTPQKYSSYEAAKSAYNLATTANDNATTALSKVVDQQATAPTDTNHLWLDTTVGILKQYNSTTGQWDIVNNYEATIKGLQDENIQLRKEISTLTSKYSQLTQTVDSFQMDFTTLTATTTQLQKDIKTVDGKCVTNASDISTVASDLQETHSYIRFIDGAIILGRSDNDYTLKIDNDEIEILKGAAMKAQWEQAKFYTDEVHIQQEGWAYTFAFVPNGDGSVSFRKVVK